MRLKCQATKTGYILLVAVVVLCVMWSFYSNKKDSFLFSFLNVFLLLSLLFSVSSPLVGLILAPVQQIQRCPVPPSERPRLRVSCDTRAWPPVPCLCRRAEELLTPMDFSFVDLAESMLCFCLPRQGPWISIFFRHSSSLPALFPLCVQPYVFLILLNLFYEAHAHFAFALSRPSSSAPFAFLHISGTDSLGMRLTARVLLNPISQPTGVFTHRGIYLCRQFSFSGDVHSSAKVCRMLE